MDVREVMTTVVLTVAPDATLHQAAERMAQRNVGSAVVMGDDDGAPGIVTERDLLRAVAAGVDPGSARVGTHQTHTVTVARPDWSLEQAAAAMLRGGFRHLVVVDVERVVGVLSMRDIVRRWTSDRLPAM